MTDRDPVHLTQVTDVAPVSEIPARAGTEGAHAGDCTCRAEGVRAGSEAARAGVEQACP